MPDIFAYLDYREYLRDYYTAAKVEIGAFSYRYFSRRAGFSSPNYLKLVMDGDRNLTTSSTKKMIKGIGLSKDEARFFVDLVEFAQADDQQRRNAAFERVSASHRFRAARRIDAGMFAYLSKWYLPAIREMAARSDFVEDPAWIARQLFPRVPQTEVAKALDLLFELGLLLRTDSGVSRGEPTWTTGHEVRSLAIGNYHRQMLERAADSIETVDREERDLSAMTVVIEQATVMELKERIHSFRETLAERCERDEGREVVYQIGIQLFPLTKRGS